MNLESMAWLVQWVSVDSPVLPGPWAMQWWLHLGWSVVLAWGFAALGQAWPPRVRWAGAGLVALWCWVPGLYSPTHWLGMAFQAPSISSVVLCAWLLRESLQPSRRVLLLPSSVDRSTLALAVLGSIAGWALLLDSFALLPMSLYAWGFSPIAPALVLLVAGLPWVLECRDGALDTKAWVAPVAVLVFVALRLPTGNAWDAVLDPWLWLLLQGYVVRAAFRRTSRLKSVH
ncbi:MAG: hypothetical protein A3F78_17840 [Burkholderiales bacterium RIFCSPLOWO2_12_FULL_61_40]|nr:MAG: hypothetical protein A3F78_17840 [Burkholderiales bacterium RIFCSPLOWO2_12_FULL_61_40]